MSEMTTGESIERFREGLKKAASRARELGRMQASMDWYNIAVNLEKMLFMGESFYRQVQLSEQEALAMVNQRATQMGEKLDG